MLRSSISRKFCWTVAVTVILSAAGSLWVAAQPERPLWLVLLVSAIAALPSITLAMFLAGTIVEPVRTLQQFAEAAGEGSAQPLALSSYPDELGALAGSLTKMAEQAVVTVDRLHAESARAAAILASMVEGVLAVDENLQVVFCNQAFTRALGVTSLVLAGIPVRQLTRDLGLIRILNNVLKSHGVVEERLTVQVDSARVFEVQASPFATPAGGGVLVILHDVTALEHLERVRQDFVANVSHELRTPLAAILGYADTLLDGALEDEGHNRQFVEVIRSHAIRLTDIAADLLTLAKLEAEDRPVRMESVPVRGAIDAVLQTIEFEARSRQVKLITSDVADIQVFAERVSLEQALLNLLTNAVKFNRSGGEVFVSAKALPGGAAQISVRDTGIGIAYEHLPRLFERFYRVDKARSRAVGGTGLGLSIVKHAIESLGGKVSVDSQLGRGSTFTITIPPPQVVTSAGIAAPKDMPTRNIGG